MLRCPKTLGPVSLVGASEVRFLLAPRASGFKCLMWRAGSGCIYSSTDMAARDRHHDCPCALSSLVCCCLLSGFPFYFLHFSQLNFLSLNLVLSSRVDARACVSRSTCLPTIAASCSVINMHIGVCVAHVGLSTAGVEPKAIMHSCIGRHRRGAPCTARCDAGPPFIHVQRVSVPVTVHQLVLAITQQ